MTPAAPRPENLDAMTAAWNDPAAFGREVAIYNRQLRDAGLPPVHDMIGAKDDYLRAGEDDR